MAQAPRDPLVTVITPAYNVAGYIAETVRSVLAQTFCDFEYLIIDDGSTDGTPEVALSAAAGDTRVRLIEGGHKGGGAARNTGITAARGKYISFIDGDDRWNPIKLKLQVDELARSETRGKPFGAAFSRSWLISEDGRLRVGIQRPKAGMYDFDELLVQNCPMGNGSSLLVRKTCFDEVGLFNTELKSAADFDMWLRIAAQSSTPIFYCDGRVLVDYRLRTTQVSRSLDARMSTIDQIFEQNLPKLKRLPPSQAYVYHAVTAYRTGDRERIERWGTEAMKCGKNYLIRKPYGRRLLAWRALGPLAPLYRAGNRRFLSTARTGLRLAGKILARKTSGKMPVG